MQQKGGTDLFGPGLKDSSQAVSEARERSESGQEILDRLKAK